MNDKTIKLRGSRSRAIVRTAARTPRLSPLSLALTAALSIGLAPQANATTFEWTGSSNIYWSNSANWRVPFVLGGYIPATAPPTNGDFLVFNNPIKTTQTTDIGGITFNSIVFGTNAGAFTFNPGFGIGMAAGGITNGSSKLQVFNIEVDAYGDQTWDGGTGGLSFAKLGMDANTELTLAKNVAITQGVHVLGGGESDYSTLNIKAGSSVMTDFLILGRDFGSMGTLLVDGAGSKQTISGYMDVGRDSTGTVTVQNGGTLNSGDTILGKNLSGDGLVEISGASSSWVSSGNLTLGEAGFGTLNIKAGAKVSNVNATLGNQAGSAGGALVTGPQSSWVLSGNLQVGNLGEAFLTIDQGGTVSNQSASLGQVGDAGTSKVSVTGAGSSWLSAGALIINSGTLDIADGGLVSTSTISIGDEVGSLAVVNLAGSGSTLTATHTLSLGADGGSATLNLGTGATLNVGPQFNIGTGGILNLNGGTLNVNGSYNLGQVNWNTGTVHFLGPVYSGVGILEHNVALGQDMNIVVDGDFLLFAGHALTLNGGQVQAKRFDNQGALAVGSFSQLSVGDGHLGNSGSVELAGGTISSTGIINNGNYWSGYGVITGAGRFINTGLLQQSGGRLELATLGSNVNNGNWDMLDGRGLVLSGGNLNNAGTMSLNGDTISGTALLTNELEGTLSGRGVISTRFQNDGRIVVDSGSLRIVESFNNTGQILLGSNSASLSGGVISNSGHIEGFGSINNALNNTGTLESIGGTLTLNATVSNSGTIVVDNGARVRLNQGLATNSGRIQLAGGTFDNNGHAMTNATGATISGAGTLRGGTLTNQGKLQLSGGTSSVYADVLNRSGQAAVGATLLVPAGQIILSGNSNTTFYGNVDVQSGAELRVSTGSVATFFGDVQQRTGAKFTGAGSKRFEGILAVGASPGFGTDEGDVEFGDSSHYLAEIGGVTACTLVCGDDDAFKNSSYDKYSVAGSLSFNGTLVLTSWNGFVGQAGQSFDLFDWGTSTGEFSEIDASGFKLAAGTQLDTSHLYTDGSIRVSVAAVPEPETYAMMLAGLGLVGWSARRRASRT